MISWWKYLPFALLLLTFIFPLPLYAHPGRTASDGCHYCRTNCASWGEVQDARHCHNTYTPPAPTPTPVYVPTCYKPGSTSNLTYTSTPTDSSCNTYDVDVEWNSASSATGYSISLNNYASSDPGSLPDTYTTRRLFSNISSGVHYIHLRGTNDCGGGSITDYTIEVERLEPQLSVERTLSDDEVDISWSYNCGDSAYYEVDGTKVELFNNTGTFSIEKSSEKKVIITAVSGDQSDTDVVVIPAKVVIDIEPIVGKAEVATPAVLGESHQSNVSTSVNDDGFFNGCLWFFGITTVIPLGAVFIHKRKQAKGS